MFYHITQIHPEFNLYQNHNLPRFQVVSLLRARTQTKGPATHAILAGLARGVHNPDLSLWTSICLLALRYQ